MVNKDMKYIGETQNRMWYRSVLDLILDSLTATSCSSVGLHSVNMGVIAMNYGHFQQGGFHPSRYREGS